ncbi:TetR/AcrR family transcriptional regulator [Endozoicomonas arenosclerae]|uniref:TetR/AcrR family transcriptional regulator n=1 Tax=Endozoicomonas arenosclerae TaxID=1633495 RepID=UPI00156158F4|nr:TetR/AcrR family transcriptional regulator [Endozoicomonas arenosclerae]
MAGRPSSVNRLKKSAIKVLIKKPGSSLAELASAAGIGRATLHRHFTSRDQLISTLLLECLQAVERTYADIEARYSMDYREQLLQMVGGFVELESEYCFLLRDWGVSDSESVHDTLRNHQSAWDLYLQFMMDTNILRADLSLAWHRTGIDGLISGAWISIEEQEVGMKQAVRLTREAVEKAFMVPVQ